MIFDELRAMGKNSCSVAWSLRLRCGLTALRSRALPSAAAVSRPVASLRQSSFGRLLFDLIFHSSCHSHQTSYYSHTTYIWIACYDVPWGVNAETAAFAQVHHVHHLHHRLDGLVGKGDGRDAAQVPRLDKHLGTQGSPAPPDWHRRRAGRPTFGTRKRV